MSRSAARDPTPPRRPDAGLLTPSIVLIGIATAVLPIAYAGIAMQAGSWWAWNAVVHESGTRSLLQTVLYYEHALRELPLDLLLGIAVGACLATCLPAARPRSSLGTQAGVALGLVIGVIGIGSLVQVGWSGVAANLAQAPLRAGSEQVWGQHWQYHLMSRLALLLLAPAAVAFATGSPFRGGRRGVVGADDAADTSGARVYWLALGLFLLATLMFRPTLRTFTDARFLGHQTRELATHLAITLPLAAAAGALLLGAHRRSWKNSIGAALGDRTSLASAVLATAVGTWLLVAALASGATDQGQADSLAALLGAHFFEHVFSYLIVLLAAVFVIDRLAGVRRAVGRQPTTQPSSPASRRQRRGSTLTRQMIDTQEESRLGNSLVVVIALALALRLPMLDVGIWFDEIRLITEFGPLPFSQLITTYGSDTNHPLYTILAWLSLQAFGEHTWALRLPSLAFGLLSLVAIARLSARILGARKAVLIAFLAAISYHHVWFSNNARGYTALLFFTVAATYELLCLLDDRGRGRMLTYALYLALATWVHTTAVFVALAHLIVIVFLAGRSRSRGMLGLALAALVSLLLHAPILGEMLAFLFGGEGHLPVASEWTNPLWTLREALRSFGIAPELAAAAGLLAASFLLLGVNRLRHLDRRLPWLFFLPAVFVTVAMVVLERNIWPRFYFNLYGFFLILAVVSLDACADWATRLLPRFRHAFAVGVGIMVLASALILPPALTVPKQDFRAAARFLDEKHEEGAAIVTLGLATKPFAAYYRKPYVAIDTLQQLNEIIAREGDVYAVDTLSTFLRSRMPEIAAAIQSGGTTVATFPGSVGGGEITVYRLSKNRVTQDER